MTRSRRQFLAGVAGSAWFAGCGSVGGRRTSPVSVLAAGSLQTPLVEGLKRAVDDPVTVEAHGSATAARLVDRGQRDPDILALADLALFDHLLATPWYAAFATNDLVVAHADTASGRRVASADRWFEPVVSGEATLGRTDPDLDPLGYRTLFALHLAAAYYDRPDLAADILAPDQLYPETALAAAFETESVDCAVLYGSMATQHGLDAIDLPAAIDLGSPAHVSAYADASFDLSDGTTVRGGLIEYGATLRRRTAASERVFRTLVDGDYLTKFGFDRPTDYPRYTEDAPPIE